MYEQILNRATDVDVAPAAAVGILEYARQSDIVDDRLPIERVLEVAQTFIVLDARDVLLVRERHRARAGDAKGRGERGVEELVVGRPHEGIADDDRSLEHGVLQEGAVIRNLV